MSFAHPNGSSSAGEMRLLDLLEAWQQGCDSGRELTPEELCPDDDVLREMLRDHIAAARALDPTLPSTTVVSTAGKSEMSTVADLPTAPPGYRILREIGRGGMGVVYEAVQTRLNRPVALKMVRGGGTGGARFLAEAAAVAAAYHPNVVQVYESGEHGGHAFLAMEYLAGGTLAERLSTSGRMNARAATELVSKLARGVQAAHDQQIVHRDLKPGNVLFDTPTAGEPKVIDFGLAKHAGRIDLTATGVILGSPAYMAPEQADGRAKFVGPGADVYALGVVLYECLTGVRPFTARAPVALARLVVETDPEAPHRREPSVPRDVELICLKCLRKDPAERYLTAAALADDLANFLAGRPVSACPVSWPVRLTKWMRRNKLAAGFIVTALLGAGVSSALAAVAAGESRRADRESRDAKDQAGHADREANDAKTNAARADREANDAKVNAATTRELFGRAAITEGIRRGDRGDEALALLWFAEGLRRNPGDAPFEAETRARWAAYWHLSRRYRLAAVVSDVAPAAVAPSLGGLGLLSSDGRRVLSGAGQAQEGALCLWDAMTGKPVAAKFPNVKSYRFAPDGKRFLTVSVDDQVRLWDAETGMPFGAPLNPGYKIDHAAVGPDGLSVLLTEVHETGPRARMWRADTGQAIGPIVPTGTREPAISPDGKFVVGSEGKNGARVFDMTTGKPVGTKLAHEEEIQGSAFSPDGKWVAVADLRTVRVWDATSGKAATPPLRSLTKVAILIFSPDGLRLLGQTREGLAQLWSLPSGKPIGQPLRHGSRDAVVLGARFSPDGRLVVTTGMDSTAKLWDAATGQPAAPPLHHASIVTEASFTADSRQVVLLDQTQTVCVYDGALASPPVEALLRGPARPLKWNVALDSHGTSAAIVGSEQVGRLIDLTTGNSFGPPFPKLASVNPFTYSGDGTRLFVFQPGNAVTALDSATGNAVGVPIRVPAGVSGVSVSEAGTRLVIYNDNKDTPVFNVATGVPLGAAFVRKENGESALSADGTLFASGSADGTVQIRNATTGAKVSSYQHEGVAAVAFSPNGQWVASGGRDRTVRVWETTTGKPVGPVLRHSHDVGKVRFSPDGTKLLTLSKVNALVWDVRTGETVTTPMTASFPISNAWFSRDGRLVVTLGGEPAVRLWDASTGLPLTPPLWHSDWPSGAVLTADGNRLITADRHAVWSWNLAREAPPVTEDVIAWSEIHAVARLDKSGRDVNLTPAEVRTRFERLRDRFPDHFGPPAAEHVDRWHSDRAAEAENAGAWFAAAFHLRVLLARKPGDKELATRLNSAAERHRAAPTPNDDPD